jgi:hypothetical protein
MNEYTYVRLRKTTAALVKKKGIKDETYDDIILRLTKHG